MAWILRTTVPAADSEALSTLLWTLHTTGVAEVADSSSAGSSVMVDLLAGFDSEHEADEAAAAVRAWTGHLAVGPAVTVTPVDERAWIDPDRRVQIEVAGQQLDLETGGAFGDGGHPSTRLALALLAEVVVPGCSVLDVGTGTGVLSLAARALGAGAVVAVDNDPEALAIAERNLASHHELGRGVSLTTTLPTTSTFDAVVANLVLGTQRELAAGMDRQMTPGGALVVAGVLGSQEAEILSLHPGLEAAQRLGYEDWLGLVLRPRSEDTGSTDAGPARDAGP